MRTKKVLVLNNIGGGIGVLVERLPLVNETVMMKAMEPPGEDIAKGGNVAVALSRLGADAAIIGKIGKDAAGDRDYRWMEEAGVDLSVLIRSGEVSTGQGIGILADNGDVMNITGISSSRALTMAEVTAALDRYHDAAFFLTGFEVRPSLVLPAAKYAKSLGMTTALNPSPVPSAGLEPVDYVDYLFVNEVEGQQLLNRPVSRAFDPREVCEKLIERYKVRCVVLTMGDMGSAYLTVDGEYNTVAPIPVTAVDSAGAGDGFMAAVVARLTKDDSLLEACRFASCFAAYSVTKKDCLPGYATHEQLAAFLKEMGR
jgi:ribokinase